MILADAGTTDPIAALISYGGALGIVLVLIVTGFLTPGSTYKREVERNDKLEGFVQGKLTDALAEAATGLRDATAVIKEQQEQIRELQRHWGNR